MEEIKAIKESALAGIAGAKDLKALDELRVNLLGKKGRLTQLLKGMGRLEASERPAAGQKVNELREFIEQRLEEAREKLRAEALTLRLKSETLDVTMPGTTFPQGRKHPVTNVIDEAKRIFMGMGYEIAEGPDVETDYYNFEALNIPANHPAKDEQDTFYVEGGFLLRTQTSPVQVRTMEKGRLPIRIIAPGRVFRSDAVDATHSPVFHQLEGLVVDKGITMGDLKGSLAVFARELLGGDTKVRFRPHHFPFTEPSAEMDAACFECGGAGCRVCKDSGWIEILGCGMVHPKVLRMSGIDPEVYSGFAFGMGLDRIALQRYAISDMRLLFENDVNFLTQF
ncbi:MAG: phenylalanine--tRNA ligase subunit alpha [Clostridiales bacterium]|jgi:phenylalanyl-tRNA synthetase alpha chain|nr:phenylalanine--tRNA ligase subunit alpha [Clostridiales bacterium]